MRGSLFHSLLLFLIVFYFINPCYGQITLKIEEDKQSGSLIKYKPKEGNTLLLFKTSLELNFESSWVIVDTIREKDIYILEVEAVSQSISLYYENIPTILNFGMKLGTVNSFPTLNIGEVKCFIVDIKPVLEYADITDNELKRGNFTTPFGPNVSDALLVVRLFPNDLDLTISETNNLISKLEKSGSTYNVFLKMPENKKFSNYELLVKTQGTDDLKVTVPKLAPKAVRFYRIKKPLVETVASKIEPENLLNPIKKPETGVGNVSGATIADYRKNIIGNWAGSLGDDKTYLEFFTFDEGKKTLAGKIYANGIYMNFKGVVIFKTENDYQASLNIIKDDLINYGASIDLRFNSGVLNGLWIDDMGGVKDFTAVRSASIIFDNSKEVREKITLLNNSISGTWNAEKSNLYFDYIIIKKANIQQITSISFVKSNQPAVNFKGKLLNKSGNVSMVVPDIQFHGISTLCTVTFSFNGQNASLTIISDDGTIIESHKLRRPTAESTLPSLGKSEVYYVKKDVAPLRDLQYVTIGTQKWSTRNLDVSTFRNGDIIRQAKTADEWIEAGYKKQPAWCYYDNDPANGEKYGKLYNWYAVNDPRGLAPKGWHIPTDAEWTVLVNYLGGLEVAGGKMKTTGTQYWRNPNKSATNESSFSGLPGGRRNYGGDFAGIGSSGYWWSSTQYITNNAWSRYLNYNNGFVFSYNYFKTNGFSVRCLRD